MILGPEVVTALIIRSIITFTSIGLPIVLGIIYLVCSLYLWRKNRLIPYVSLCILLLTVLPLFTFRTAIGQGAYLFVYFALLSDIGIVWLIIKSRRGKLKKQSAIIGIAMVSVYTIVALAQPLIMSHSDDIKLQEATNRNIALLKSHNLDYYIPSFADENTFESLYAADGPVVLLQSGGRYIGSQIFIDKSLVPEKEKCLVFEATNDYVKRIADGNVRSYAKNQCKKVGVIGEFSVWTTTIGAEDYTLYNKNTVIVIERKWTQKNNATSAYIDAMKKVSPERLAQHTRVYGY